MIDTTEVPRALLGPFKRVTRRIPVELKKDEELIKTVYAFLQLGSEKLARQVVEAAKKTLELEMAQKRKKAREEALIRAAEARLAALEEEASENEDDLDDADDEDDETKTY
jgi:hypothetical protein